MLARAGYHATTMADIADAAGVSKGTPYLAAAITPLPSRRSRPWWPMLPEHEAASQPPASVNRKEVRRLVEAGAQLVEVLPREEFDEEHLPDAISLPLRSPTAETSAALDRSRPVIVYCWDGLSAALATARAGSRLGAEDPVPGQDRCSGPGRRPDRGPGRDGRAPGPPARCPLS